MPSTAISAQGSTFSIASGTGSAVNPTAIAVGYPTILTKAAHGLTNGTVVDLANFAGADAATINGKTVVIKNVTTNTFAVDVDTTGKTITTNTNTATVTPETYTKVSNLKTFQGFDGQPSDIDKTNLDSTAKEYTPGLVDNGTFTIEVDRDLNDAGQLAVDAARVAGTTQNFKLVLPNGKTATFAAYVKKFGLQGGVDQVVKTPCEMRITGAVSWS